MLPRFLDALAAQSGDARFMLCLLLDSCTDASEAIVRARIDGLPFETRVATTSAQPPNAGHARRQAMEIGLALVGGNGAMIISTDADTVPDPNWLLANRCALEQADIATGSIRRIDGDPCAMQDRIEAYYDALYAARRRIDPVAWEASDTHHYTSAASMAFRVGAYRSLGGFAPIGRGEDGRIVDAAQRLGLRVRRDAAIRVQTSARRDGRAVGGLADHLRQLDAHLGEPFVAHPADLAWRYRGHAAARRAWGDMALARGALSATLGCDVEHIDRVAADAANAEAFATRVVPDVPGGERSIPLAEAEAALAHFSAEDQAWAA